MLEEAIYKFKVSGPTIMPSLFDNFFLNKGHQDKIRSTGMYLLHAGRAA